MVKALGRQIRKGCYRKLQSAWYRLTRIWRGTTTTCMTRVWLGGHMDEASWGGYKVRHSLDKKKIKREEAGMNCIESRTIS